MSGGGRYLSCWGDDGIIGIERHVLVLVLTDLAAICYKLAENSAVREEQRVKARQLGLEFDSLAPYRGKSKTAQHYQSEQLLAKIARFLPNMLKVQEDLLS